MKNTNDKEKYISTIEKYLISTKSDIKCLLQKFNWDEKYIKQKFSERRKSSLNQSKCLKEKHLNKNTNRVEDVLGSETEKTDLQNYESLIVTYSSEERLKIYDDFVSKNSSKDTRKSHLDEMSLSRDLKRRRAKYKVSNKYPRYTEVMREMIEDNMKLLDPSKRSEPEQETSSKYSHSSKRYKTKE